MPVDMNGLLWYGDSHLSLAENVGRAARAYEKKFGVTPEVCFVNPSALDANMECCVEVRPLSIVLVGHYWIGVEDAI